LLFLGGCILIYGCAAVLVAVYVENEKGK